MFFVVLFLNRLFLMSMWPQDCEPPTLTWKTRPAGPLMALISDLANSLVAVVPHLVSLCFRCCVQCWVDVCVLSYPWCVCTFKWVIILVLGVWWSNLISASHSLSCHNILLFGSTLLSSSTSWLFKMCPRLCWVSCCGGGTGNKDANRKWPHLISEVWQCTITCHVLLVSVYFCCLLCCYSGTKAIDYPYLCEARGACCSWSPSSISPLHFQEVGCVIIKLLSYCEDLATEVQVFEEVPFKHQPGPMGTHLACHTLMFV